MAYTRVILGQVLTILIDECERLAILILTAPASTSNV